MSNLASTLTNLGIGKASTRNVIHCYKSKTELGAISAASEEFYLVRFPLKRIALSASAKRDGEHIVLDINASRVGQSVAGYVPKVFIIQGHSKIEDLMASEQLFANMWVGKQALLKLNIQADDAISQNELASKLNGLVCKNLADTVPTWIKDIYPFENYFIFEKNGDQFKQDYVADPVSREVALAGKPARVFTKYDTVPKAEISAQILEGPALSTPVLGLVNDYYTNTISQAMNFDPINNSIVTIGSLPGTDKMSDEVMVDYGPPLNEVNNGPKLFTMTNIEEALRLYLTDIKNGNYTPLSSISSSVLPTNGREYMHACREAEIAARCARKKINIRDFIYWQGKRLRASKADPSIKIKAKGTPASGGKYSVGDDVKTQFGPGKITAKLSKDTVTVKHAKGGKVSNHHTTEIARIEAPATSTLLSPK